MEKTKTDTKQKQTLFTVLPRTPEVYKDREELRSSKMLRFYKQKRARNILIWSLIFIEPIVNVITFLSIYLATDGVEEEVAKHYMAMIGMWTSVGVLAAYIAAYVPIILGNKIWIYEYNKTIIIVYLGIIRCHLVIDEKLWDKKPKKSKTLLYGILPDGQKIEVIKDGISCQISMDIYQKPIRPVI